LSSTTTAPTSSSYARKSLQDSLEIKRYQTLLQQNQQQLKDKQTNVSSKSQTNLRSAFSKKFKLQRLSIVRHHQQKQQQQPQNQLQSINNNNNYTHRSIHNLNTIDNKNKCYLNDEISSPGLIYWKKMKDKCQSVIIIIYFFTKIEYIYTHIIIVIIIIFNEKLTY
jgi:hypothetical protein